MLATSLVQVHTVAEHVSQLLALLHCFSFYLAAKNKKTWPISHFHDQVNRQPTWLLTRVLHSTPQGLLNGTSQITRGDPTLTTDWIHCKEPTVLL